MRDLRPASQIETANIYVTLGQATERSKSEDLLAGFPFDLTQWFFGYLKDEEFENLFLFWDGSAWDESPYIYPRKLLKGLSDFIALKENDSKRWTLQLENIIKIKSNLSVDQQPFLILIGLDENSPLLILDGNHRAVATLWHVRDMGSQTHLPFCAWVGLSQAMVSYHGYNRIINT